MFPRSSRGAFSVSEVLRASWSALVGLKPTRPMKYPYTLSAKVVQFPWKFYYRNQPVYRYYPYGVLMSVPVFWYISRLANSPANKAKWAEIRRKELEGEKDDEDEHYD